ncbi:MAG: YhdH/YhfP family quinone oxidoreductase [Gammaproteobacteria bacterium]|nr:YhdH/YhfP family quinone oxidoreductase [Gammaproteobacteria bacterium]
MNGTFRALRVSETANGVEQAIVERSIDDLPAGDVLIRVSHSSVNYKDALSASGNKAVTRQYPHTPGIDAAGVVESSSEPSIRVGEEVLVMGYDLGMNTSGGFSQYVRVPASWVIRKPARLSLENAMVFGTAGFTAAMCVDTLLQVGISPDQGPVLVTGATGGVGIVAVWLLHNQGFEVVAATGKSGQEELLKAVGADSVISRATLLENANRPMNRPVWAAAVDTVGGDVLGNILKSIRYGGSVACCGMVAGHEFTTSVFPFILRGVNLLGVDSVELPLDVKQDIWNMLGDKWTFDDFADFKQRTVKLISLDELPAALADVLQGTHCGRYVVKLG